MNIDYQWLAGFVEGDGCFSVHSVQSGRYKYPKIEVHQKNLEPLIEINKRFSMPLYRDGISRCYSTGAPAQRIYDEISPFLSKRRRLQAEQVGLINKPICSERNASWVAGYYEAEGCVTIRSNGYTRKDGTANKYLRVSITQYYSDETSIMCRDVFPTGRVVGPHRAYGQQRQYAFVLSKIDDIKDFFVNVSPMVSASRIEQYQRCLQTYEQNVSRLGRNQFS